MQITGTVIVGGSMYAEWFKLEPVFEIASLNSQGYLLIGLFTASCTCILAIVHALGPSNLYYGYSTGAMAIVHALWP